MTLYAVSQIVRRVGHIWHIEYPAYGAVFRAELGPHQLRIVVPRPSQPTPVEVPPERNSLLYIVECLLDLEIWLASMTQVKKGEPSPIHRSTTTQL